MIPNVEFSLIQIQNNIRILKEKCKKVDFIFPVKCCNNQEVLDLVGKLGMGFDVSNMNEYNLIKKYADGRTICSSGPLSYELSSISGIHVAANSFVRWNARSGIRVNFNSDRSFELSHFGVDYTEISENMLKTISYVHFHNSDHRDKEKCTHIIENIKNIISHFQNLKTLNIGGHLEDLDFDDGIAFIQNVRSITPASIKLIVEAGDFLFNDAGRLTCEVLDCYMRGNSQIVILNFSKMANQRWVYPKLCDDSCSDSEKKIETFFYGCSCCEGDLYLKTKSHLYSIGETVIFNNISPYSYQWKKFFNGINSFDYAFLYKL